MLFHRLAIGVCASMAALCDTAAAQFPLAYPQASTGSLSGNFTPLGGSSLGLAREGRYQVLIPADHLPGRPARIRGLEIYTTSGTGLVVYSSLSIRMGSILGAPALSTSFVGNLANSTQVYLKQPGGLQWTERQWTRIPLGSGYAYDGISSLVIDFQKVIAPNQTLPLVSHATALDTGLPRTVYTFGAFGSGVSQASSATFSSPNPLFVRLILDTPTLELDSPTRAPTYNHFALGGWVDVSVHNAPGQLHWTFIADGFAPFGIVQPGLAGTLFLDPNTLGVLGTGAVPATGPWTTRLAIPNTPGLVGQSFVLQAVTTQPSRTRPTWTNASSLTINS